MNWGPRFRVRNTNKLKNVVTQCAKAHSHRSKLEASVCDYITVKERAGLCKLLCLEDKIYLSRAMILYKPDFKILNNANGLIEWIEAKGMETRDYRLKERLWKFYGPGQLTIMKSSRGNLIVARIIKSVAIPE